MVPGYKEVMERFHEERLAWDWSQQEISSKMGITQSHFSKAELGKKRFMYEQIKRLNETEFDLHYVFTGNRVEKTKRLDILEHVSASECYFLGRLFYVLLEQLSERRSAPQYEAVRKQSSIMRYVLDNRQKSIWRLVRDYCDCTQAEMADFFKFDLKKYACLENEKTYPDSESIYLLYKHFYIPPQIVLGDNRGIVRSIYDAMAELDDGDYAKLVDFIKLQQEMFG